MDKELEIEELDLDEETIDEETDERMEDEIEEDIDEDREELIGAILDIDDTVPLHKLPVTAGTSAVPPFFSTCTPNVALCPGCKPPFQLTLFAV